MTGMSGAGRSVAARALEDLGWFVVDNLPPQLLDDLVVPVAAREEASRLAVVVDVRGGSRFDILEAEIADLRDGGNNVRVLFLEATDETLVRRFEAEPSASPAAGRWPGPGWPEARTRSPGKSARWSGSRDRHILTERS